MGRLICSLALVALLLSVAGGSAPLAAAQDSGEILIVKTICDGQGASSLNLAGSPEEAAKRPDDCLEGQGLPKGEFVILDATSRSLVTTLTTDPATGVASASLPPGTYEVVESSGATIPPLTVTVISGQTTVVHSIDYTERIDATTCGDELDPAVPGDPEPIVSGGPRLRWRLPIPEGTSAGERVAATDEAVFLALSSPPEPSSLVALDVATGAVRWCNNLDNRIIGDPIASGGLVLASLTDNTRYGGSIVAFESESGDEAWRSDLASPGLTEPAAGDDVVYALDLHEGTVDLVAFDLATGRELWRYGPASQWMPWSAPVIGDTYVYLGATIYGQQAEAVVLIAVDATTGRDVWTSELAPFGSARSVTVSRGTVFVGSWTGEGCCVFALNGETGEQLWRAAGLDVEFSNPAVAGGQVYVGGSPGVVALDAVTGTEQWRVDLGGPENPVQSSPVVVGDQVYIVDPLGSGPAGEPDLVGLEAASGAELW